MKRPLIILLALAVIVVGGAVLTLLPPSPKALTAIDVICAHAPGGAARCLAKNAAEVQADAKYAAERQPLWQSLAQTQDEIAFGTLTETRQLDALGARQPAGTRAQLHALAAELQTKSSAIRTKMDLQAQPLAADATQANFISSVQGSANATAGALLTFNTLLDVIQSRAAALSAR